ncbi:MAG: hypothetical protein KDE34_02325, partial [Anaerolineales bacterium]|nr:hypothetical protein [Anaerolineales bacterium]
PKLYNPNVPFVPTALIQDFFGPTLIPTPTLTFEGIDNLCGCLPPDPNSDVGPNHIVEMVNVHFAIYDKSGTELVAPSEVNSIWSGFGGPCEVDNSGDPVVIYDHLADRWVLTQFAVDTGSHECFAVSTSADPTGTYNRYAFDIGGFPDYPKIGLWEDSYLATYRNFGATFDMQAAAYNRDKMLAGDASAETVIFSMTDAFLPLGIDGYLPVDLDGPAPTAGSPAPFMGLLPDENGFAQDALAMFELDVDWTNPGAATFTGPEVIPVAPFDHDMCDGDRDCIPQPGTAQGLDAIADRILHRLAYRNFGFYEAIVAIHTVNAGTAQDELAGERWYELRNAGSGWDVYQQGTYAPDSNHRWMGSIAMDGNGNIAMGYSVSSDTVFPSIRYTGRLVGDPLGMMTLGEGEIIAGSGVQTSAAARWGDYSSLSVDPVDDCTFWYTTEYIETSGNAPWQTRIGSFTLDNCNPPAEDDFSIWTQPSSQEVCAPAAFEYAVTAFEIGDFASAITLSASGVPTGYSAAFAANPVNAPESTTLTLTNTGAATQGSYTIEVSGVGASTTHTDTVNVNLYTAVPTAPTLTAPADGAINQPVRPVLTWAATSGATSYEVEVASDPGFVNIVDSATVDNAIYQVSVNLSLSTTYYWRVAAVNACGAGATSTPFSFTTVGDGTSCPAGLIVSYSYWEDFDAGAGGWTHSAATGPDTWALQSTNPSPGSGGSNFHANDHDAPSDQRLASPDITLPTGATQLTLQFWNEQAFEDPAGSGGCWDGGILEISTDAGANWTLLNSELLSDPYDGIGDNGPPAGVPMWCGETGGAQPWLNSIVDMSAFDGQTVRFRFSMLTDAAAGADGWNIDDVRIASCVAPLNNYLPTIIHN